MTLSSLHKYENSLIKPREKGYHWYILDTDNKTPTSEIFHRTSKLLLKLMFKFEVDRYRIQGTYMKR